jgi:hypothetical protein
MDYASHDVLAALGMWGGLIMTLLIASSLLGDGVPARLGQHLLVGAAVGYGGVLAVQHILRPQVIAPLLADPLGDPWLWIPAVLGGLLLVAGVDRTLAPSQTTPLPRWRRLLHGLGRLPVALLIALGLSAGLFGALQGTLLPQFGRAAALTLDAGAAETLLGILTLLITTASLLYVAVDPARHLAGQSPAVRRLLGGWLWLGQRAIWLAAGVIFARLLASRLSLLIARVEYVIYVLSTTPLRQWWERLFG